jgi:hypothetical protein
MRRHADHDLKVKNSGLGQIGQLHGASSSPGLALHTDMFTHSRVNKNVSQGCHQPGLTGRDVL